MFTGIIEGLGKVVSIENEKSNFHFTFESTLAHELKIDQSLAHNGVCLTVVKTDFIKNQYCVTAIDETMNKTNLGTLKPNDFVNLERCMRMGDRLDGHVVQGHVDSTALCVEALDQNGSWKYTFEHSGDFTTVEKGSITVNGTSLTVVDSENEQFSVCIIPYTFEHTVFKFLKVGDHVNLEFDILGKYVQTLLAKSGRI
jgi:riboflavin synthase